MHQPCDPMCLSHVLIFKNDVIHNVHCYFVFFGIPVVILSIHRINAFSVFSIYSKNKLNIPNRPNAWNNCSEVRKSYKQHGYLDKNNSRHTVHFWAFDATHLTPLRLSINLQVVSNFGENKRARKTHGSIDGSAENFSSKVMCSFVPTSHILLFACVERWILKYSLEQWMRMTAC